MRNDVYINVCVFNKSLNLIILIIQRNSSQSFFCSIYHTSRYTTYNYYILNFLYVRVFSCTLSSTHTHTHYIRFVAPIRYALYALLTEYAYHIRICIQSSSFTLNCAALKLNQTRPYNLMCRSSVLLKQISLRAGMAACVLRRSCEDSTRIRNTYIYTYRIIPYIRNVHTCEAEQNAYTRQDKKKCKRISRNNAKNKYAARFILPGWWCAAGLMPAEREAAGADRGNANDMPIAICV